MNIDDKSGYVMDALRGATEAELRKVDRRLWEAIKVEGRTHVGAVQPEENGPINILMALESLVNSAIVRTITRRNTASGCEKVHGLD